MAEHMIVFRNDFEDRALARLVSQDANRERVTSYVAALAAAGRVVESLIVTVFFGLDFEFATGAHRDRWGALLGEIRGGLDEAAWKRYQAYRIYVNTEQVTVPRMVALLEDMFSPKTIEVYYIWPNLVKFWVIGGDLLPLPERAHAEALFGDFHPPGAAWVVLERPSNVFTFDTVFSASDALLLSSTIYGGY